MKIEIDDKHSFFTGIAGSALARVVLQLEGRKQWIKAPRRFKFETSEHNLRLFRASMPNAEYIDNRTLSEFTDEMDLGQGLADRAVLDDVFGVETTPYGKVIVDWEDEKIEMSPDNEIWPFVLEPYGHQMFGFRKLRDIPHHAIFAAPGTGKTKMEIDILCRRYIKKQLTLVIIFSWPKGVHHQWIEDELPKHIWKNIDWVGCAWNGKTIPDHMYKNDGRLKIVSTNIESANVKNCMDQLHELMDAHPNTAVVIDESQTIKNPSAKRFDKVNNLGKRARFRTCMTGTPIARDLRDEWGQFMFLDPNIIGIKYKTAFQAMYCVMGGYENDSVIQHRNIEHFKSLVAPYQYRVSKEPLGLPPMITDELTFSMTPEQKRLQGELKKSFIAMLDNGEIVSVVNAASMFIRLQQIASGYAVDSNGVITPLRKNPRLDALKRLADGIDGKKIVWCRFKQDVETLMGIYGDRAMDYYGPTPTGRRKEAISRFTDENDPLEFLIASPAAAGAGLNLQGACHHAIFYTNSFNFIDREQAESRIHRIGTRDTVYNFDIIARGSVDRDVIRNLRRKKNFSDFILDDIRGIVNGL